MKQMIQLTIMVSFLVNGMAGINVADSPNFIDAPNLDFAAYLGYEATPTAAPSRDSITMVAARLSDNPLSGLEIFEQSPSSLSRLEMVAGNAADRPYFIDAPNLDFAVYPSYEATPTPAPSRDSIAMVVARVSSNPLSGLGVLVQKSSPSLSWLGPDGEQLSFRSNEEIEEFLRTAEIVSRERVDGGLNRFQRVLLEKDGIRMHAIFRDVHVERSEMPLSDGKVSFFFRDDAIFECAAYELAKLLGLDTVPPVVERKIQRTEGTLQAWVENATTQKALREETDIPPSGGINRWRWIMQRQNIYIFDNLIYNEDRNIGNILIEPDWKLWMIDHTRAFRRWKELMNPEQVQFAERSLWEKLQALDETEVRAKLKDFLKPVEMNGLIARKGLLVDHIQKLIDDRGEKAVLFTLR
ncbi:MAG: hypothetical protein IH937_04965 [Acidobacteria bacterium]|nr:hypothetical protein [Acidobacteriota bacterium]